QVKSLAIQDGNAQALLPTPFTAATEDYALARRLFFYTPTAPKDPLVRELVDYTLSEPGQTIVGEIGFVPRSLRAEVSASPPDAPPAYAQLVSGATRLSVNFRFKRGSAEVDTKGLRDLDRLTQFLASPMSRGRHVVLAGFADAEGAKHVNVELAK